MVNHEVVRWDTRCTAEISAYAAIARRQSQRASAERWRDWLAFWGALARQRQSEVDREFARVLARSGGRITDSMEREMMRKALEFDWSLPR